MKNRLTAILIIIFSFFAITSATADYPSNFSQAKKLAGHIFAANPTTLYCGCRYDPATKKIDLSSCNMQSAESIDRAHRLEWEHMMPAENFGRQLQCWRANLCERKSGKKYKGRACCGNIDPKFKKMEAELYNLWPSVGLVNGARSNYRYTQFSSTMKSSTYFYGCPFVIDTSARSVEPRDEAKGIVARANLFMSEKYGIKLSDSQRNLFKAWNKKYPPAAWEKEWAGKVAVIEGYDNPYISSSSLP